MRLYCVRNNTVVYWPHALICDLAEAGGVSPREIVRRVVSEHPLSWVIA